MSAAPSTLAELSRVAQDLQRVAVAVPEGPALTYGALLDEVEGLASAIRGAGLSDGTVVGIVLGNEPGFLTTFLGVANAGAVAAPLNPAYTQEEFRFYLEDARAGAIVLGPGDHPAREAAEGLGIRVIDLAGRVLQENGRRLPRGAAALQETRLTPTRPSRG